jgi:hypothetical protein
MTVSTDYREYPEIPLGELRILWIHDYWDGALSGMLGHRGRLQWFECCSFSEEGGAEQRRYLIRDLTDAEVADEEQWHALFVEHVGDHWTAREDSGQETTKPQAEHAKFYGPYSKRTPPEYSTHPILGWFSL